MHVAITTVSVDAGAIDEVAELFAETNPALVRDERDWLGAWFTANRERGEITVIARWADADSYRRLSASASFQEAMARFAPFFEGPPHVTVNEVLIDMDRQQR